MQRNGGYAYSGSSWLPLAGMSRVLCIYSIHLVHHCVMVVEAVNWTLSNVLLSDLGSVSPLVHVIFLSSKHPFPFSFSYCLWLIIFVWYIHTHTHTHTHTHIHTYIHIASNCWTVDLPSVSNTATERCSQCDTMRKKRSTGLWEVPGSDPLDTPTVVDQMSSSLHLLEKRVSELERSPHSCHYGNTVYTTGAKWLPAKCLSCSCEVSGLHSCVG